MDDENSGLTVLVEQIEEKSGRKEEHFKLSDFSEALYVLKDIADPGNKLIEPYVLLEYGTMISNNTF